MKFHALTVLFLCVSVAFVVPRRAAAQDVYPSAQPVMILVAADGTEEEAVSYDGSAPLNAVFRANPQDVGDYVPRYEWRFTRVGETAPMLVRYEEDTQYTFMASGSFTVELLVSFVQGTDTIEFRQDAPFVIGISESRMELPNAFTPNGDGINDVFKVKEGHQSIISFEAAVFNRWGRKLYEWTDIEGGWDGKSGGSDVPDGAYYLVVKARGADGREYRVKKTINVLRGYTEGGSATAGG